MYIYKHICTDFVCTYIYIHMYVYIYTVHDQLRECSPVPSSQILGSGQFGRGIYARDSPSQMVLVAVWDRDRNNVS